MRLQNNLRQVRQNFSSLVNQINQQLNETEQIARNIGQFPSQGQFTSPGNFYEAGTGGYSFNPGMTNNAGQYSRNYAGQGQYTSGNAAQNYFNPVSSTSTGNLSTGQGTQHYSNPVSSTNQSAMNRQSGINQFGTTSYGL